MKIKVLSGDFKYKIHTLGLQVIFVFLFSSFFSVNTNAQGIEIKAEFDTTVILIGDQIHLNIFIDQPQGAKIVIPALTDSLVNKVEILTSIKTDTAFVGNGRLKLLKRFLITSFDSGVYQVPPLKFAFQMGAVHDTITTVPLVLVVNTIPIKDSKKIFDIKKLLEVPYTFAEFLPYILIGFGILLITALAIYIIMRIKQKKPIFFFQKPPEPPQVIAFRELEKLKSEKLWQQGLVKQYYTSLTDIVRKYIEGRYIILAMESTTDEILNDLNGKESISVDILSDLKRMLVLADLVKFAKGDPLPDENDNSWKIAYDFVFKTYQRPVEETDQNNKVDLEVEKIEK